MPFNPQQPQPFKDFVHRTHRHAIEAAVQQNRQTFEAFRARAHNHLIDFDARQADAQRLRSLQSLPRERERYRQALLTFEEFGHEAGSEVIVEYGRTVVIGRSTTPSNPESTAKITIEHPEVSRAHAELSCDRDGLWVRDLRSTNGTFVNGERVHRRTRLEPGDTVLFGPVRVSVSTVPEPPVDLAQVLIWILALVAVLVVLVIA